MALSLRELHHLLGQHIATLDPAEDKDIEMEGETCTSAISAVQACEDEPIVYLRLQPGSKATVGILTLLGR